MKDYTNITMVVRSVGERTEAHCVSYLRDIFGKNNVVLLNNIIPFSAAVQKTFEIGIANKKKWTLAVDADVFLFEDQIKSFIRSADNCLQRNSKAFCFEGKLFDKFSQTYRLVGVHLYQTRLLQEALKYTDAGRYDVRPEFYVKKSMVLKGYGFFITNQHIGIHDFFQHPLNIVLKAILHCKKNSSNIDSWSKMWNEMKTLDSDFNYALLGKNIFKQISKDDISVDHNQMKKLLAKQEIIIEEPAELQTSEIDATLKKYNNEPYKYVEFRESAIGKMYKLNEKYNYWYTNQQRRYEVVRILHTEEQKEILIYKLYERAGYIMDFENPRTFNEKLNWLKIYWREPLLTKCADKYRVRNYIEKQLGEKYLLPLLGVWNKPEDICFEDLPEKYMLKVNWGSGQNIAVKSKQDCDYIKIINQINEWMQPYNNNYYNEFEWSYKNIQPQIIAEPYIQEFDKKSLCFKIFCFDGFPKLIQVVYNDDLNASRADYFDLEWNKLPIQQNLPNNEISCPKPNTLPIMLEVAKKLSAPFPWVRIDLYEIKNKVFFSECTFYPNAGTAPFNPPEWDVKLGKMLNLDSIVKLNNTV